MESSSISVREPHVVPKSNTGRLRTNQTKTPLQNIQQTVELTKTRARESTNVNGSKRRLNKLKEDKAINGSSSLQWLIPSPILEAMCLTIVGEQSRRCDCTPVLLRTACTCFIDLQRKKAPDQTGLYLKGVPLREKFTEFKGARKEAQELEEHTQAHANAQMRKC